MRTMQPSLRRAFIATATLFLALAASHAHATQRALLVAVSDYPHLPDSAALEGPANDAVLVEQVLTQWGFKPKHMQVLTEAQPDDKKPSRANILNAFDQLIGETQAGDFVFIHMAGHGTQVPATEASREHEPDGLDELFLPRDVQGWGGAGNSGEGVVNAIQDDEIGDRLTQLRAKDAKVWIIFDSCHSGTMTRSAMGDDIVLRRLSPELLGIPEGAMLKAEQSAVRTRGQSQNIGPQNTRAAGLDIENDPGIIQFFAAQTHQEAPELTLPRGGEKRYGLFTYSLMSALASGEPMSYRQLAQHIQGRYRALPYHRATPEFRGALDEGIFGGDSSEFQASAKAKNGELVINAGQLHDYNEGALVALLSKPTDTLDDAIGYARITRATAMKSHAQPEAHNDKAAMKLSGFFRTVYARMAEPTYNPALRIAMLPAGQQHFSEHNRAIENALQAVAKESSTPLSRLVHFQDNADSADFLLFAEPAPNEQGSRLYFLTPGNPLFCGLQQLDEEELTKCRADQADEQWTFTHIANHKTETIQEAVQAAALRISRALNLLRIANSNGMGTSSSTVETQFLVQKQGEADSQQRFDYEDVQLSPGDSISLHAINNDAQSAFTAHVFFISSQWEIQPVQVINLAPGAEKVLNLGSVEGGSFGREQLLVITDKRGNKTVSQSFAYLAQPGLDAATTADIRLRSVSPTRTHSPLDALLRSARGDVQTRGFGAPASSEQNMHIFGWETVSAER